MIRPMGFRCHPAIPHSLAGALIMLYYTLCMPTGLSHAEETMSLTITSNAFTNGGGIPTRYTCQGKDISPPLDWRGGPHNARA